MEYAQNLTLDLNSKNTYTVVGAKQGDSNSRVLNIYITEDGTPYDLSQASTAYFRLKKPDNTSVMNSVDIMLPDNYLRLVLTPAALAAAGRGYADVVLYDAEQRIMSSVAFILQIMASPNIVSDATSSSEFLYLQDVVDNAQTTINEAEAWAVGTRSGKPVTEPSFWYDRKSGLTIEVDENTFHTRVTTSTDPVDQPLLQAGESREYTFTYRYLTETTAMWFMSIDGAEETSIDLSNYGITTLVQPSENDYIIVHITEPDLQYNNYSKYWAENSQKQVTEAEAWANGMRNGETPVIASGFDVESSGSFTYTVNESTFRAKSIQDDHLEPGDTKVYVFTYSARRQSWLVSIDQSTEVAVNLGQYGITVVGDVGNDDSITVTITQADTQYNNHAKYWARQAKAEKEKIQALQVSSTTIEPTEEVPAPQATVTKEIIEDILYINFGIPRGETGNVYYPVFDIDPTTGELWLSCSDRMSDEITFSIDDTSGYLILNIDRTTNNESTGGG